MTAYHNPTSPARRSLHRLAVVTAMLLVAPVLFTALARRTEADVRAYIERYQLVALEHELTYHIPACITLAQGLLESDAGLSELASKHNNHFGIKSFNWRGDEACFGDSSRRSCYRVYGTSEDSFLDHARFLLSPRYQPLYDLDITDYRAWAEGLRQCGYAEDRAYAQKLISIIERYKLNELTATAAAAPAAPLASVDNKARTKAEQQAKRAAEKAAKDAERARLKHERELAKQRKQQQQADEQRKHEAEKAAARAERERILAQREQEREQEQLRQQQRRAQEKRERAERYAQRQAAAQRQKAAAEAETQVSRRQLARNSQAAHAPVTAAASADND